MTQEQWNAIKNNDKRYDGVFFYALKSTGNVCRPSCPARACRPENVIIFEHLEDALAEGYRPCRRCCPEVENWEGTHGELAKRIRILIDESYEEKFSLDRIASELHMDKNYLLRVFKAVTGMTMLQYHNSVRCRHAGELLQRPELTISYVGSTVGFKTPSHFTRVFKQVMGSTPAEYRRSYFASFV